jgi:predicted acetyltransferase
MNAFEIRPVQGPEYEVLAWLWQCFRHDLAGFVAGVPYPDGRYQPAGLPTGPSDDVAAYLVRQPHPRTGEPAPVAFVVVKGLTSDRNNLSAMWVTPTARSTGLGRQLALDVIRRHPGAWTMAFQAANERAVAFWRRTADEAFGAGNWREVERAVPGDRQLPPDHWIETL